MNTKSKTEQIRNRLKKAGQFRYLNEEGHIKAIAEMDKEMEAIRREYKVKERDSIVSASQVTLTV